MEFASHDMGFIRYLRVHLCFFCIFFNTVRSIRPPLQFIDLLYIKYALLYNILCHSTLFHVTSRHVTLTFINDFLFESFFPFQVVKFCSNNKRIKEECLHLLIQMLLLKWDQNKRVGSGNESVIIKYRMIH